MDNNLDTLLNLDADPEQTAAVNPDGTPAQPSAGTENKKVEELLESNKQLQEQVRQMAETNKGMAEFLDTIRGNPKTEAEKKKKQETLKMFDQDPEATVRQIMREELSGVKTELFMEKTTNNVDRAMKEVDKDYVVDWDKDWQKVAGELKKFAMEVKQKDPKGTLLSACRLAGCIKKRAVSTGEPPIVAANTKPGSRPAPAKHSETVNSRLDKIGKKQKSNKFKI